MNMKLKWQITRDGWTSERHLVLYNEKEFAIWGSKSHLHEIDQKQFDKDFKFLVEKYGISENLKFNIEECEKVGRVT